MVTNMTFFNALTLKNIPLETKVVATTLLLLFNDGRIIESFWLKDSWWFYPFISISDKKFHLYKILLTNFFSQKFSFILSYRKPFYELRSLFLVLFFLFRVCIHFACYVYSSSSSFFLFNFRISFAAFLAHGKQQCC